jgi:diguanylate cyclase (GGDEF)-like protein/PAS domain S-box-containing protein
MKYRRMSGIGRRVAQFSVGGVAIGLVSALVVAAMVAATVLSSQAADVHRRAQILADQVRAATQEMSALKWRANSDVLAGTADLSFGGALFLEGARILSELDHEIADLERLQPGADAHQLRQDVQALYLGGMKALALAQGRRHLSHATLMTMQEGFQPLLDRLDSDALLVAGHQQAVATGALERSLIASIGSLLLGIGALGGLGLRVARLRRRAVLAERVREVQRRSEARIRALVEHSNDVVTVLDRSLRVRWQAASVRGLLGVEPDSLIGAPIDALVHPDDRGFFDDFIRARLDGGVPAKLRARLRHADGRWCYVETIAEDRFADPAVEGLVLNMRDVSERKEFEDQLRHQAFHDALTGLANRALFEDRLGHALTASLRTPRELAVLFLDIDDFKMINDSLGHRAGDQLLGAVASRIDSVVRPTDTAARLGGDEFAVLVDGVESDEEAHMIARRMLQALTDPFTIDGRELTVTASIGIAFDDGSLEPGELLRNADIAMYAAKEGGKDSITAFEQTMHRRALKRLELRGELQRALVNKQFELDYQPIISLRAGQMVGAEALIRWQHPVLGRLAPDQFVALAEESGMIVSLGRWILEQACSDARDWALVAADTPRLYVSVNVSIRQLREHDFPHIVQDALAHSELDHQLLVLELTEGLLVDDPDAISSRVRFLKELGVRIAIDDFGTGYSALSQLQRLPIDIVKIDKSFIDGVDVDSQNANLVQGIINLGGSMHLDVIAEGIEQAQQADRLMAMRARLGQGFLFSRPLRPDQMLDLLRSSGQPAGPPAMSEVTR